MKVNNIRLAARSGLDRYLPDSSIIRSVYDLQIKDLNVPNDIAIQHYMKISKSDNNKASRFLTIFFSKDINNGDKQTYKVCRKAYYKAKSALKKEEKRLILVKRRSNLYVNY